MATTAIKPTMGMGDKRSGGSSNIPKSRQFKDKEKPTHIRESNIVAAKAVADAVRTSLGPKGMDKMIQSGSGDVTITNDGATILKQMKVLHPAAKMLVDLSKAQDIAAGDGTTTVVVMAGALLNSCNELLSQGIHPTQISESLQTLSEQGCKILEGMSIPVDLSDRDALLRSASTALNSKVVSQFSSLLSGIAVDAILKITDLKEAKMVDIRDIKIVKKLGGTIEDSKLIEGLVFDHRAHGVNKVEKAKIGLIQFQISPPKTDMDNQVIVSDYAQMDRVLKEERQYILNIVKAIKKAGCNVLLVQKSILRDAVSDLALHFLAKLKIMVIKDVERDEVEFICKTLSCRPIASLDHFVPEALGSADLVEEILTGAGKIVQVSGILNPGRTCSVLLRGSNKLVLEEADRSLHDAVCVVRCLVRHRALIAGGGAPEVELALGLADYARASPGVESFCIRCLAGAFETIPYTLAQNAGLNAIATVTDLRNRHARGERNAGINVRTCCVSDIIEENVVQPLTVSQSALSLSCETVRSILKIDDILNATHD